MIEVCDIVRILGADLAERARAVEQRDGGLGVVRGHLAGCVHRRDGLAEHGKACDRGRGGIADRPTGPQQHGHARCIDIERDREGAPERLARFFRRGPTVERRVGAGGAIGGEQAAAFQASKECRDIAALEAVFADRRSEAQLDDGATVGNVPGRRLEGVAGGEGQRIRVIACGLRGGLAGLGGDRDVAKRIDRGLRVRCQHVRPRYRQPKEHSIITQRQLPSAEPGDGRGRIENEANDRGGKGALCAGELSECHRAVEIAGVAGQRCEMANECVVDAGRLRRLVVDPDRDLAFCGGHGGSEDLLRAGRIGGDCGAQAVEHFVQGGDSI